MLIDESMPDYIVRLRRELVVAAPSDRVYAAILTADLGALPLVRLVHSQADWLRRWHRDVAEPMRPPFRLLDLRRLGFVVLGERAGEAVVLGAVLRLWSVRPQPQRIPAEFFGRITRPGYVKTAVAFSVGRSRPTNPGSSRRSGFFRRTDRADAASPSGCRSADCSSPRPSAGPCG
jgi:hypothetical protein